jgi:3-hydroxyisobutyrate dehydrogenase-like beta-hydroxyacid dehydrogenase
MSIKNIAVIGLGAMGGPMAARLLESNFNVSGFDIDESRMTELASSGLKPSASPKEAADGRELVILSLPDWNIVRDVVEGERGIVSSSNKRQIIIDTSTVPPEETRAMASRLEKKGIEWMDVPISGAASQAREGNVVFMAGGKRMTFDKVKPILDLLGKKTVYVGKNGDAAMLKLAVNVTLFLNQAAAIEGFVLAMKAGLDPDIILDIFGSGAAASNLISVRGKDMLEGNFRPRGPVWLAVKDIELALDSAKQLGVTLPIAGLYHQLILNAYHSGLAQSDATALMKVYEQLAGIIDRHEN